MDPATFFLILMVIPFAVALRIGERIMYKPAAIEPPKSNDNDALACNMWEIRRTQFRMVEAGIIKEHEVSVCENEKCEDCTITRKHINSINAIRARANLRKSNALDTRDYKKDYEYARWKRAHAQTAIGGTLSKPGEPKPITVTYNCITCGMLSAKPECAPCVMSRREVETYETVSGTGEVIATWTEVIDPESRMTLGFVGHKENGGVVLADENKVVKYA